MKINILFWLNISKKNKQGLYPLYCRITVNKQRAEISTGIYLKRKEFDSKKKRVKNEHPLADVFNSKLSEINIKLNKIFYENKNFDVKQIKQLYYSDNKKYTITQLTELIYEFIEKRKRNYLSHKAIVMLKRYQEIIEEYQKKVLKKNILVNECNYYFFEELSNYLHHKKNYRAKYIKKIIELVKASLKYAYEMQYISKPPVSFSIPFKDEYEIIYLNEIELEKISKHRFLETRLQQIADCFLVQCYTGLAYADLKRLNSNNIVIEKDGLWIKINRQKVKSAKMVVPVLRNVKGLLIKYNFKLPVISNQKYNAGLKEIAAEVGIHKKLSSHVGRKTFGTLMLNHDVPIETVSKLLGHSNIGVTQKHYAQVLHMKIAKDVRAVF